MLGAAASWTLPVFLEKTFFTLDAMAAESLTQAVTDAASGAQLWSARFERAGNVGVELDLNCSGSFVQSLQVYSSGVRPFNAPASCPACWAAVASSPAESARPRA